MRRAQWGTTLCVSAATGLMCVAVSPASWVRLGCLWGASLLFGLLVGYLTERL